MKFTQETKTITVKVNIKYILHKTSNFELTYRIHFLWLIAYQSWGSFFDVLTRNDLRRTSIRRRIVGLETKILCLSVCLSIYLSVCLSSCLSICFPVFLSAFHLIIFSIFNGKHTFYVSKCPLFFGLCLWVQMCNF